jgi:Raf kinase inhibitor-like YbhB/YbcL family protein
MKISSPIFKNNQSIPALYTCDDQNINPPLEITEVPANAKSLVLIMDDPDVPRTIRSDGLWVHWLVWNMPADTKSIPENTMAPGITGTNTRGNQNYGGPCPPDREHRYFFKLYALDTTLDLETSANKDQLEKAMGGRIIEQAELIGLYKRNI